MLMCEQSEGWKDIFFSNLFDRQGNSHCKFKNQVPPRSNSRKVEKNSNKVEKEIEKLLTEGHITKLDKCTSDCFIAPIVITIKKDDSIKLAMDAKPINRQLFKKFVPNAQRR